MSNTVLTITPWRDVHEIIVKTKEGRACSILIHDNKGGTFETNVVIKDPIGPLSKAWDYLVATTTPTSTAKEHFEEALKLIVAYLLQFAPADQMTDFWNPCNAPFVSVPDQTSVLTAMGIMQQIRLN